MLKKWNTESKLPITTGNLWPNIQETLDYTHKPASGLENKYLWFSTLSQTSQMKLTQTLSKLLPSSYLKTVTLCSFLPSCHLQINSEVLPSCKLQTPSEVLPSCHLQTLTLCSFLPSHHLQILSEVLPSCHLQTLSEVLLSCHLQTLSEVLPSCHLQTLSEVLPSCHLQTVTLCSSSKPTVSNIFPVHEKSSEQMPPEWPPCKMDSVSLVMESQTCTEGGLPIWAVATVLLNLGCWLTVRAMISSVCFR